MPVFFKDDRSVLFIHIPKAAGSTMERAFRKSGWQMMLHETRKTQPRLMPVRRCSPQHYHAALLHELLVLEAFDVVFTVAREPVSRFRSEYLMRNHRAPRVDAAAVDSWARRVLASRKDDPYTLDNHLRPQHEFLVPGTEVYKVEQGFEQIITDLNERFDLDLVTEVPRALHSVERTGVGSDQVQVSRRLGKTLRKLYAEDYRRFGY